MTIKEFSKEIGKSESTVRTWKRRGELPPFLFLKIGGDIFIKIEKFKELVQNNTSGVLREI